MKSTLSKVLALLSIVVCVRFSGLYFIKSKKWFVLCCFWHLGDNVAGLLPLDEFIKTDGRKIAAFVTKNDCPLVSYYPNIDRIHRIPLFAHRRLRNYFYKFEEYFQRKGGGAVLHPMIHSGKDCFHKSWFVWQKKTLPIVPRPSEKERIIVASKSVLFIPNSISISSSPVLKTMEDLARDYLSKGYSVYVNGDSSVSRVEVAGAERPVTIFPSLEWLAHNADSFETIIGIRTGLFDFLCAAGCKTKMVIFYDDSPSGLWNKENWPICFWSANAKEVVVKDISRAFSCHNQ